MPRHLVVQVEHGSSLNSWRASHTHTTPYNSLWVPQSDNSPQEWYVACGLSMQKVSRCSTTARASLRQNGHGTPRHKCHESQSGTQSSDEGSRWVHARLSLERRQSRRVHIIRWHSAEAQATDVSSLRSRQREPASWPHKGVHLCGSMAKPWERWA